MWFITVHGVSNIYITFALAALSRAMIDIRSGRPRSKNILWIEAQAESSWRRRRWWRSWSCRLGAPSTQTNSRIMNTLKFKGEFIIRYYLIWRGHENLQIEILASPLWSRQNANTRVTVASPQHLNWRIHAQFNATSKSKFTGNFHYFFGAWKP